MKRLLLVISLMLGLGSAPAMAVIMLDPIDPILTTGFATVQVDVTVSGLEDGVDEIVSAFHIDLLFDPALLSVGSVVFGDGLDPLFLFGGAFQAATVSGGTASLAEVSLYSDDDLAFFQGDSVLLATVFFDVVGEGIATFDFFLDLPTRDIKGRNNEPILPIVDVPEPGMLTLLGTGLLLVGVRRRRVSVKKDLG